MTSFKAIVLSKSETWPGANLNSTSSAIKYKLKKRNIETSVSKTVCQQACAFYKILILISTQENRPPDVKQNSSGSGQTKNTATSKTAYEPGGGKPQASTKSDLSSNSGHLTSPLTAKGKMHVGTGAILKHPKVVIGSTDLQYQLFTSQLVYTL